MILPCKFSEKGCDFVGIRAALRSHEESCLFREVECPQWNCTEKIQIGLVVDHLKGCHGSIESQGYEVNYNRSNSGRQNSSWAPYILSFDGRKFFLNCVIIDNIWNLWLTVLGGVELAEKYEVKLNVPSEGVKHTSIAHVGKVHSTDTGFDDVIEDHEGILDFSHKMSLKLGCVDAAGAVKIPIGYQILHKLDDTEEVDDDETGLPESHIKFVMNQAKVSRARAIEALEDNANNITNAIDEALRI